jgi:four helix bundle protein
MKSKYFVYSFEKLEVYKDALSYGIQIRDVTAKFPQKELFKLTKQLERSVDSIATNIAEGSGRASNLDQAHFTNIAYGSALETISHLNLAKMLNYINEDQYIALRINMDKIINQLNSLYKYQLNNKQGLKSRLKE